MRWTLTGMLTVFALELYTPPKPAEACGVKLTVKSKSPRKAVARSSNPSTVLLLGNPPRRLQRDLSAAGHKVETAQTTAAAKQKTYTIVIADSGLEGSARTSFAGAFVVVRSSDVTADLRAVEKQVGRTAIGARDTGTVVAAREARKPVAAGPAKEPERKVVAAIEPKETAGDPPPVTPKAPDPAPKKVVTEKPRPTEAPKAPDPAPKKVVTEKPRPIETPVVTPDVEPKAKPVVAAKAPPELYFGINSSDGGARGKAIVAQTVRWLGDNPSMHVVIEGYADPTGDAEYNKALAQKRADWVYQSLVDAGIDASRLEVISYGDTKLKYGATDARNRRIAITPKTP